MNRTRFRAAFGAAAIITTIAASGAAVSPAVAAATGDHGSHAQVASKDKDKDKDKGRNGGNHDSSKLAKAVAKVDRDLERLLSRAERVSDEHYAPIAANIAADRAALVQLTTRQDVRALQPENYDKVIAWVRKVERLEDKVDGSDVDITDAAAAALAELFTITASSDRSAVSAAKQLVNVVKTLVDAAENETEVEDEVEDEDEVEGEVEGGGGTGGSAGA